MTSDRQWCEDLAQRRLSERVSVGLCDVIKLSALDQRHTGAPAAS